jgi:hypothetical protein
MSVQTGFSTSVDDGEAVQENSGRTAVVTKGAHTDAGVETIDRTNVSSIFYAYDDNWSARGTNWINFTFSSNVIVRPDSQIAVSMCERNANGPAAGDASMTVMNVVPSDGVVAVRFNVAWSEQLPILFNFIIVN